MREVRSSNLHRSELENGQGRFQAWDRLVEVICFEEEGGNC